MIKISPGYVLEAKDNNGLDGTIFSKCFSLIGVSFDAALLEETDVYNLIIIFQFML